MTNQENFQSWFASNIRKMAADRSAGFIVAMVCFPLLERYLRQLTKAEPKSPKFIAALLRLIPELESIENAKTFWIVYRHGLLHDITMSRETHGLTHDSKIVEMRTDSKVWLNPEIFSERVLTIIEKDFDIFESGSPLPTVSVYPIIEADPTSYYNGTSATLNKDNKN